MRVQKVIPGISQGAAPYSFLYHTALRIQKFIAHVWVDIAALVIIGIVFVVPFVFILLTAAKPRPEAALFEFTWPSNFQLSENIRDVMVFGNNHMFLALWNSTVLT